MQAHAERGGGGQGNALQVEHFAIEVAFWGRLGGAAGGEQGADDQQEHFLHRDLRIVDAGFRPAPTGI
ncbi:hypothetical protein D3C86_1684450 [compost metagenome]